MSTDLPPFRDTPRPGDAAAVRAVVTATQFFRPSEIDVAVEVTGEWLAKGDASDYWHLLVDAPEGGLQGYASYGPIPGTESGYNLYWLIVAPASQGKGLGRRILDEVERRSARAGGKTIYAETSGMALYAPTRAFYLRCGYREVARLKDFYIPGDDKVTYAKPLVVS